MDRWMDVQTEVLLILQELAPSQAPFPQALRPSWQSLKSLPLALMPIWQAQRPLWQPLRPPRQALRPSGRLSDPFNNTTQPVAKKRFPCPAYVML